MPENSGMNYPSLLQENSRSWKGQPLRPFSISAASFLRYSIPRSTRSPTRYVRSTHPISPARVPLCKFARINCFDVSPFGSKGLVHGTQRFFPQDSLPSVFLLRLAAADMVTLLSSHPEMIGLNSHQPIYAPILFQISHGETIPSSLT
jgi:hypothetical protein